MAGSGDAAPLLPVQSFDVVVTVVESITQLGGGATGGPAAERAIVNKDDFLAGP